MIGLTVVRHFIAVAVVTAVLPRVLLAQQPDSAPLRIPAVWDTSYVMLLEANAEYRPSSQDALAAVIRAHQSYQLGLIEQGRTIRGGPLVQVPGAALVGMTVLRALSPEEAQMIANADPGVKAGLFRTTVRTWNTPAGAAMPDADPRDVRTIEGIMHAFYDVINGPPGQPRQWERDRTLYMPGATFVSMSVRDGRVVVDRMTPEEYRVNRDAGFVANGALETQTGSRVERFGNVAQVRSVGEFRRAAGEPVLARFVNYVNLYFDGTRWWVASAIWDEERPGNEIPAEWVTSR